MYTSIQKWGNSQGVRLPKLILEQAGMKEDESIEIIADKEQIIIKKFKKNSYASLEELFKNYNGDYDCSSFDWGIEEPVGEEIW